MSSNLTRRSLSSHEQGSGGGSAEDVPRPSPAYFESMRIATELRKRDGWAEFDKEEKPQQAGWKTILAAFIMLISGLVLFITGCVIYWGHTPEDTHTGFDMLIVGAVCKSIFYLMFVWHLLLPVFVIPVLLPGSYGGTILYGAWKGWPGYHVTQLTSYDE